MKIINKFTNSYFIISCVVWVFVVVKKLLIIWFNKEMQCNIESRKYYIVLIPNSNHQTIYRKFGSANLSGSAR